MGPVMPNCIVGVLKEVAPGNRSVALTPKDAAKLTNIDATVFVESGAGYEASFSDSEYIEHGALVAKTAEDVWGNSDIIVKIEPPRLEEYELLGHASEKVLFSYLNLGSKPAELTRALLRSDITAVACEAICTFSGGRWIRPILDPFLSMVGREAMRAALARHGFDKDLNFLNVVIIRGGIVGESALRRALERRAFVVLFEEDEKRIRELKKKYRRAHVFILPLATLQENIGQEYVRSSDVVIISAPESGDGTPPSIVLTGKQLGRIKQGCYIADTSVEQGGSTAWTNTSATIHGEVFKKGSRDLVFSATSYLPCQIAPSEVSIAHSAAILPYLREIAPEIMRAAGGAYTALRDYVELRNSLQTYQGFLTNKNLAHHHKLEEHHVPMQRLIYGG